MPLTFITFAYAYGKLYKHYRNDSCFLLDAKNRSYGNEMVYGALFLLQDFDFYIRLLDAYHACSLSTLYKNHVLDTHHRKEILSTPIHFNTLDDFSRLMYTEKESVSCFAYFGNPKHSKISRRLRRNTPHRIVDGVDKANFISCFGGERG